MNSLPLPTERSAVSGERGPRTAACFEGRLSNGMEVLVLPDRRGPVATHMVWYRNGSSDDPPGKSGLAHFLEHLMFKGTARHPAGQFGLRLAAMGGEENAFTSWNFTAYHQRVPGQHLAACMAYEADRMRGLVLDEAVVARERDVILEERGMIADANPSNLLAEVVAVTASPAHPAGRPIIGWRHEIMGLTRADALAYYRRFYTPANAILIVAGDAEPDAVLALAEEIYGAIPADRDPPERTVVQDPPSRTHRTVVLAEASVRQPELQRLHLVPSPAHAAPGEAEAIEVVVRLLGGETGLLHTRLVVNARRASAIRMSSLGSYFRDRSRVLLTGIPAPGVSPEDLDGSVEREIETLRATGFDAEAVERAKTQLLAESLYARDSQVSLANWYGMALCCGLSTEQLATWQARIEAVTPGAVAEALTLLDRRHLVSGYLVGTDA